jgi:hypothetical protein
LGGIGQAALRIIAAVLSLGVLLAFLLALTVPLQLLARFAFMEAYQKRFPVASEWMFEQIITASGLAAIAFLARRQLGGMLLAGVVAAFTFGIPILAGVSVVAMVGFPAMLLVQGWLWIAGGWPAGWVGAIFGVALGASVGVLHALIIAVLVAALVDLEW